MPPHGVRRNCIARLDAIAVLSLESNTHEPVSQRGGPGTELSKLLKKFGIESTPTCQCRAQAAQMDALGPDECERPERINEVVAVMRDEAKARGLPFIDAVGRMLVKRAIRNARRAAPPPPDTSSPPAQ
jgi:hypothetical protein